MHLEIIVTDADTNEPLPARLTFRGEGVPPMWGKDAIGQDMTYMGAPRLWCNGRWEGDLPDVPIEVVIARPYEYGTEVVQIEPISDRHLEVALKRRCDMPAQGWHCGDAHQHVVHGEALLKVNLPMAAAVARAEGIDWMVFDQGFTSVPGEEEPEPAELERLCTESSQDGFLALWAEEYPKHDLGHLASFPHDQGIWPAELAGDGLYHLEEGARTPYATFESVRVLQRHGSTAIYVHPPRELGGTPGRVGNIARELPLDTLVAPWAVEAIDLMTDKIDDPICWGMWHMLLNQGHRIGLCTFNDACYDRAGEGWCEPVAYRRTYVKIDGKPSWQNLVAGIRAGHTFGTTGPLVLFEMDGKGPGQVFAADGKQRTGRIRAWGAPSYHDPAQFGDIVKVEVIRNGKSFEIWDFSNDPQDAVELEFEVGEKDTAWYVARVDGSVEKQLAMTSPIYLEGEDYRQPKPYPAQVKARIFDAKNGAPLNGTMELVEFSKGQVDVVESREFSDGEFKGSVSGDLRLRAVVKGYKEKVLSPILNCDLIYRNLLGGIRSEDLADAAYYARLREALDDIELEFAMIRSAI